MVKNSSTYRLLSPFDYLLEFIDAFWRYREYLKQAVARDLRKQYKRSVLGYIWSMLNPLLMMLILAVVFSKLMDRPAKEYAVFLLCGMLPWEFFSSTIAQALTSIRGNMSIITQVPVPKYIFPLAMALSNLTTFLLSMISLLLIILITGASFHWTMLALPIVLLPLFLFTMGFALLCAVSNVFFEDTQHLTGVVLRGLYFLCPIIYPRNIIQPPELAQWLALNPLFEQIEFMRVFFIDGTWPDPQTYLLNLAGSLLFLMAGLWVFRRTEDKFIYFT